MLASAAKYNAFVRQTHGFNGCFIYAQLRWLITLYLLSCNLNIINVELSPEVTEEKIG